MYLSRTKIRLAIRDFYSISVPIPNSITKAWIPKVNSTALAMPTNSNLYFRSITLSATIVAGFGQPYLDLLDS